MDRSNLLPAYHVVSFWHIDYNLILGSCFKIILFPNTVHAAADESEISRMGANPALVILYFFGKYLCLASHSLTGTDFVYKLQTGQTCRYL